MFKPLLKKKLIQQQSIQKYPAPRELTRTLGIDIGVESLKAVCLIDIDHNAKPTVDWVATVALSADAVKDGVVVKRREVAAQIRRLAGAHRCAAMPSALAIPIDQAVVRWIDLPPMSAEALAAATPFEARKYLPYPPDQAEVLILPLQSQQEVGDGRMRALLVAAPRDVVNSRAETLEMAGMSVACMEMEPFALVRALDRPGRWRGGFWRGQSQGFLQLGSRVSGLYVMQDASPRFVRSIAWGVCRLTQAIADARGCTLSEAQALLDDPTAALDASGGLTWAAYFEPAASAAISSELERLCREIERLLSYYRSLYPERSYEGALSKLILCGDAAGLQGLDRYFARVLQIDVEVENPFQMLTGNSDNSQIEIVAGQENLFTVAYGLALGQLAQRNRAGHTGGNETRDLIWRYQAA